MLTQGQHRRRRQLDPRWRQRGRRRARRTTRHRHLHRVGHVERRVGATGRSTSIRTPRSRRPRSRRRPRRRLSGAAAFQSVTPFRFADSRVGQTITRLPAGQQVRIQIAGTAGIPSDAHGGQRQLHRRRAVGRRLLHRLQLFGRCSPRCRRSTTRRRETVANQAVVPLDRGALCVYSHDRHAPDHRRQRLRRAVGQVTVRPGRPQAARSTPASSAPLAPERRLGVAVAGQSSPAPLDATAVALNLTATDAAAEGWVRVFPCDAAEPGVSNVNVRLGGVRANSVIVPAAADGSVCLTVEHHHERDRRHHRMVRPQHRAHVRPAVAGPPRRHPQLPGRAQPGRQRSARSQPARCCGCRWPATAASPPMPRRRASTSWRSTHRSAGGSVWSRAGLRPTCRTSTTSTPAPVANGANVKLSADGAICVTSSRADPRDRRRQRRLALTPSAGVDRRQRRVVSGGSVSSTARRSGWCGRCRRTGSLPGRAGGRPASWRGRVPDDRARTGRRPTG